MRGMRRAGEQAGGEVLFHALFVNLRTRRFAYFSQVE